MSALLRLPYLGFLEVQLRILVRCQLALGVAQPTLGVAQIHVIICVSLLPRFYNSLLKTFLAPTGAQGVKMLSVRASVRDIPKISKQAVKQAGKQASRQAGKQASRLAHRQSGLQAGRQAGSRQARKEARKQGQSLRKSESCPLGACLWIIVKNDQLVKTKIHFSQPWFP